MGAFLMYKFKRPTTKNAVNDRIKCARKQIAERIKLEGRNNDENRGIVIDISESKIDKEEIIATIYREIQLQCHHTTDVIIIDGGKVIQVIRRHK